jgi:hypothetical protein
MYDLLKSEGISEWFVICMGDEVDRSIGRWWHMMKQMDDGNYEVQ